MKPDTEDNNDNYDDNDSDNNQILPSANRTLANIFLRNGSMVSRLEMKCLNNFGMNLL